MKAATEQFLSIASQYKVGKVILRQGSVIQVSSQNNVRRPFPTKVEVTEFIIFQTFITDLQKVDALRLM